MEIFTDVYYAPLPKVMGRRGVFPPKRAEYILQTSNPLLQRQRYYVWLLLEHALGESFNKDLPSLALFQNERGVWESPHCYFSLSHSENAVAVAVSNAPVGVDIQKRIDDSRLAKYILSPEEIPLWDNAEDKNVVLTELWTKKESIFKTQNAARFAPSATTASAQFTQTVWLTVEEERYALSCTSPIRKLQQIEL